jgi:hypothetical protein
MLSLAFVRSVSDETIVTEYRRQRYGNVMFTVGRLHAMMHYETIPTIRFGLPTSTIPSEGVTVCGVQDVD